MVVSPYKSFEIAFGGIYNGLSRPVRPYTAQNGFLAKTRIDAKTGCGLIFEVGTEV